MPLSEESFRALLDPNGVVRDPSALPALAPEARFLVFSQAAGARFDAARWRDQAARFFATKLGFTHDKRPSPEPPLVDASVVEVVSGAVVAVTGPLVLSVVAVLVEPVLVSLVVMVSLPHPDSSRAVAQAPATRPPRVVVMNLFHMIKSPILARIDRAPSARLTKTRRE